MEYPANNKTEVNDDDNINIDYSKKKENSYDLVVFLQKKLDAWTKAIRKKPSKMIGFKDHVMESAKIIQNICISDDDFILGCIQLSREHQYSIKHSIHTAIVSEIVAKQLDLTPPVRMSLVCAAITMNIPMKELQDILYSQQESPIRQQKHMIYNHPNDCADILEKLGINDNLWLMTVRQHHETLDGVGYPLGLKGRQIVDTAAIINIVDRYLAGISKRSYRPALLPQHVLKRRYDAAKEDPVHKKIVLAIAKTLGAYPPGTLVRLKNNEVGVVINHCELDISKPVVYTVLRSNGKATTTPLRRDTNIQKYAVQDVIPPDNFKVAVNPYQLWGHGDFKREKMCRRKYTRVKTKITATIVDKKTLHATSATIINISEGGCLVKVKKEQNKGIHVNSIYSLIMKVLNKTLKDIYIKIKHVKEAEDAYLFGTIFVKMSSKTRSFLMMYIDKVDYS